MVEDIDHSKYDNSISISGTRVDLDEGRGLGRAGVIKDVKKEINEIENSGISIHQEWTARSIGKVDTN